MTNPDTTIQETPKPTAKPRATAWIGEVLCNATVRSVANLQGLMISDDDLKTLKYGEDDRLNHRATIQAGGELPSLPGWYVNGEDTGNFPDLLKRILDADDPPKDTPPGISIMDVLGTYNAGKRKITLHREMIRRAAAALAVEQESLATVVLIHEAAHASFHIGRDFDGTSITDDSWAKIPSWLHEMVAQYITYLAVKDSPELLAAFTALCGIQMEEYLLWRSLAQLELTIEEFKAALVAVRRQGHAEGFGGFMQRVVHLVCAIRGETLESLKETAVWSEHHVDLPEVIFHTLISKKREDVIGFFRSMKGLPIRQRGSHEQWSVNGRTVPVPVRRDLGMLTLKILREAGTCRTEYMRYLEGEQ